MQNRPLHMRNGVLIFPRDIPLLERKAQLKQIIPKPPSALLYLDHIEGQMCVGTNELEATAHVRLWPRLGQNSNF